VLPQYDTSTPHVAVDSVFLRLLPALGHTVHVIRPAPGVRGLEAADGPSGRVFTFPYEPSGVRHTYIARLRRRRRFVGDALKALSAEPIDAVIVRNDFVDAGTASRFAVARRIPFAFQYTSPEPEFLIKGPRNRVEMSRGYFVARGLFDRTMRHRTCRRADAVLAISARMRRYLIDRDGLSGDRIFVLPMGIGSNPEPTEAQVDAARRAIGGTWRHTLVYSGVIDALRQPEFMLDVLARVRTQGVDAGLVVLTRQQDARRRAFEAAAAARGLPVRILGPLHHEEVSAYVRCGDLLLCPVPDRIEFAMMSPTKSLEALGVGVPVVGSVEVDEHRRILEEGGGGLAVPFHVEAFAGAVVALVGDPDRRRRMGGTGRQFVRRFRTYPRLARYLESVLLALVDRRPPGAIPHDPDDLPWDKPTD